MVKRRRQNTENSGKKRKVENVDEKDAKVAVTASRTHHCSKDDVKPFQKDKKAKLPRKIDDGKLSFKCDSANHPSPLNKRRRKFLDVGDTTTATVLSAKGLHLRISLNRGGKGCIHVSEMEDDIQLGSHPLTKFKRGQRIVVRLLKKVVVEKRKGASVTGSVIKQPTWICSLKKTPLKLPNCDEVREYSPGEKVVGYVSKVSSHAVFVDISDVDFGIAERLDLSCKLKDILQFRHRYKKGHSYSFTVLRKVSGTYSLSALKCDSVKMGSIVVGEVIGIKRGHGLVLNLPQGYKGCACVTDISDDYQEVYEGLQNFLEEKFVQCFIISINNRTQRAVVSLRKSRISNEKLEVADREILSIEELHTNDEIRGIVKSKATTAMLVTIARDIEAVVNLSSENRAYGYQIGSCVQLRISQIQVKQREVIAELLSDMCSNCDDPTNISQISNNMSPELPRCSLQFKSQQSAIAIPLQLELKSDHVNIKNTEESQSRNQVLTENQNKSPLSIQEGKPHLQVASTFVWGDTWAGNDVKDSSSSDESETEEPPLSGKRKRQKSQPNSKLTEAHLLDAENRLLDNNWQPETVDDFDRLLLTSPNSSVIWLKYMAFHLQSAEIDKARAVAERALKTISFREEQEKLNVWIGFLNLENLYGTKTTLDEVLQRALQYNEPLKVFNHFVRILVQSGKLEDAEHQYNVMLKRFSNINSVWVNYGLFLIKNGRRESAHKLLERCLKCLPKREHMNVISQYAQMEYKYGDAHYGRSMMEGIISSYPKRIDVWSVYIDMVWKVAGDLEETRRLFDRAITMNLPPKKMKFFFKRYLDFEKQHGNHGQVCYVKQKASDYVRSQQIDMDLNLD